MPPAEETWSLNHWTAREVLNFKFLQTKIFNVNVRARVSHPFPLPATHAPALRWTCVPLDGIVRCFHLQSPVQTAGEAGIWFSSLHHFLFPDSCWKCASRVPTKKPNLGDKQKRLMLMMPMERIQARCPARTGHRSCAKFSALPLLPAQKSEALSPG